MRKAIITVAPTGEGATKRDNPALPTTPSEIADSVYESWQAGAAIAHLHMRDADDKPTMATDRFVETVARVRERCDIVINLTTAGDIHAGDDIRLAHLQAIRPEMASFDAGSMNWAYQEVFVNSPAFLARLAKTVRDLDIKPEIEIFDTGMIDNARHYIKTTPLRQPVHFQFVLGCPGGMPATIENLIYLTRQIPEGSTWSAFGIGRHHIPIMAAALLLGGDVRVGFEDNIYYAKGQLATSNAQLVERAARLAREFGREVATPGDVRADFGLRRA